MQAVEQLALSLKVNNQSLRQSENSLWKKIEAQFKEWNFTDKEKHIGELILRGLSNKQIAGYVNKSVRTVENQIQILFSKTGFASRNEFMAYFFLPFLPEED